MGTRERNDGAKGEKKEKEGGRGRGRFMWARTGLRLCSRQINLLPPSVPLSLVAPRMKRTGSEGRVHLYSRSALSFYSELSHNTPVQPLQASACVGFQLDDPLPSVVAVVQVQEVCVRVQAVLTCRKHTETTLIRDTKSSRKNFILCICQ